MSDMACPGVTQLGAYVLGSLPADERAALDAHLLDCPVCAAELSELETLPPLLDRLSIDDVTAESPVAPDDLFDRVAGAIDRDEKRTRRNRRILAAAAAVVVAGGTAIGINAATGGGHPAWHTFQASSGQVQMHVDLVGETTGTQLRVHVAGLPDDEHCRLVAVSRSGERDPAGSWTATYSGGADVTAWTSYRPDQLSRLVLLGTDGQRLVTVNTA